MVVLKFFYLNMYWFFQIGYYIYKKMQDINNNLMLILHQL